MKKPLAALAVVSACLTASLAHAQSSVIQNPPRSLASVKAAATGGDDSTLVANDAGSVSGNQTSFMSNPAPMSPQSAPGNGNPGGGNPGAATATLTASNYLFAQAFSTDNQTFAFTTDYITFLSPTQGTPDGTGSAGFGQGGASYTFTDSNGAVHTIASYNITFNGNGPGLASYALPALPPGSDFTYGSFDISSGNECTGDGFQYTGPATSNLIPVVGAPESCASFNVSSNWNITFLINDPNSTGIAMSITLQACDASGFCTASVSVPKSDVFY